VNMSWLDWGIIVVAVVALRFVSQRASSQMKGVADFLSANRLAGRYLLTIASAMGNTGIISIVAVFEMVSEAGVAPSWWGFMGMPVSIVILLTGWVFWRFRETRALTMAQFFEMRYSRNFRIFAGVICWGCGVLNFGIFPAVAARFIVYFCGLPPHFQLPGLPWDISTFAVVMALDLGFALMFVNMGGQISVMVTECVQGMFTSIAFVLIIICVMVIMPWSHIATALLSAPPEASMVHPFHTSQVKDFNIWFYLIGIFGTFYGYMSWQGTQGFYSSARSPHEQQMGGIISFLRGMPAGVLFTLLPLAALAVLKLPEFSAQAAAVQETLKTIPESAIRNQMTVPIVLAHLLPIGIKGLLAVTMLFFSFTCHDTYMHSWGSIFVQDVVMPIRQKMGQGPLSPEAHIRRLRWSIAGVAIFSFLFSLLYPQTQKIYMFFAITGTIWLGGSGAVVVGGLYWKRGTTAGAYAAVILGAVLGVSGLFADQIWQFFCGQPFPINGQWLSLIGMVSSLTVYILVSLVTGFGQRQANLKKILHRDEYAVGVEPLEEKGPRRSVWLRIVGITEHFSFTDKVLAFSLIGWNVLGFSFFCIVTVIHLTIGTSTEWWLKFWHFYLMLLLCIGAPAVVWFTIGGIGDIRALFAALKTAPRDPTDDGRVEPEAPDAFEKKQTTTVPDPETGAPEAEV